MIPNWMIPNRSTTKIGATRANSVIVWPRSFFTCTRCGICDSTLGKVRGALAAGGEPRYCVSCVLRRDDARHVLERGADTVGEESQRPHDEDGDHCQDDAVFGHRLPLLHVEACAEVMDQIRERHGFTPFRYLERARRAVKGSGAGGWNRLDIGRSW